MRVLPGRSRPSGDGGSLLLLVIGYAVIAMAFVAVAVDVSAMFLARRGLAAVADGAAVAAASAVDADALYAGRGGDTLPLSDDRVRGAVEQYLAASDVGSRYSDLQVLEASTDGVTVTVSVQETQTLTFLRLVGRLSGPYADGRVPVRATARARAPYF